MRVLKNNCRKTEESLKLFPRFSPISFAIMAGYKSNWALLQHYSDFFFISVFYHQHLCVGCKPLILKMVTTLRIQTTPKNAIKCEIWYCNKSLPSNFVPNTMWVHYHQIPVWWAQFTKVPYFLGYWPLKIPNLKNTHLEKYRL